MALKKGLALAVISPLLLVVALYLTFPDWFLKPLLDLNRSLSGLEKKVVTVADHEVHYLDGGEGETLVLLHGIFAEKDHWVEFARPLTANHRVVALDIPGFGASSRLQDHSYEYPDQVERLHAIVNELELDSLHLAGNSMGGTIAALYAMAYPETVRSVAFIGAPQGVRIPEASVMDRAIEQGRIPLIPRTQAEFDETMDLVFAKRPFLPRPILRDAAEKALTRADSNLRLWEEQRKHWHLLDDELPRLTHPTLVLWGEQDDVFDVSGADVVESVLENVTRVIMPETGHLPMMERPRDSAEHYLAFLADRAAVTGQ